MCAQGAEQGAARKPKVCRTCGWDPSYVDEEGHTVQDHVCVPLEGLMEGA